MGVEYTAYSNESMASAGQGTTASLPQSESACALHAAGQKFTRGIR
jgi:hypothetical protein